MLDREIVCVDKTGKPQFRGLLFHRGDPCFFAFDLLMRDGNDWRTNRLGLAKLYKTLQVLTDTLRNSSNSRFFPQHLP